MACGPWERSGTENAQNMRCRKAPGKKPKSGDEAEAAEPPRRSGRQRREVSYSEPSMAEVLARAPAAEVGEALGFVRGRGRGRCRRTGHVGARQPGGASEPPASLAAIVPPLQSAAVKPC